MYISIYVSHTHTHIQWQLALSKREVIFAANIAVHSVLHVVGCANGLEPAGITCEHQE